MNIANKRKENEFIITSINSIMLLSWFIIQWWVELKVNMRNDVMFILPIVMIINIHAENNLKTTCKPIIRTRHFETYINVQINCPLSVNKYIFGTKVTDRESWIWYGFVLPLKGWDYKDRMLYFQMRRLTTNPKKIILTYLSVILRLIFCCY